MEKIAESKTAQGSTILGWFFVIIIGLSLVGWIVNDIVSGRRALRVGLKHLEGNVEKLGKSLQSLATDRYVVYINVGTGDTLYLPAFEKLPEYDAGVNFLMIERTDTVGRVGTPKE